MAQAVHPPRRYRGFVLTAAGLQKLHERIQQLERQTRLRQSSRTIAERVQLSDPNGIHPITVRKILGGANGVDKRSIQLVFQVLQLQLEVGDYAHAGLCEQPEAPPAPPFQPQDWREAVNHANLYGFVDELAQLKQAITPEHSRLVQILGMAGVGKTALASLLVKAVQPEFVIWKSLQHAPTIQTVLTSILQHLTQRTDLPTQTGDLMALLIEQLQNHRCLLVFDHFDSVLEGKQYAGYCRQGYEAYSELLEIIAAVPHQSCLVITSRERPRVAKTGAEQFIHSLQLKGLPASDCQQIFSQHQLIGTLSEQQALSEQYQGNPLILKTVAVCIQHYFEGYISTYLQCLNSTPLLFGDLRDLLAQQFARLSPLEQELVRRLALCRAISVSEFCKTVQLAISPQDVLEGLDSLSRRLVLQQQGAHLSLDPMMSAYVNSCLIQQDQSSVVLFRKGRRRKPVSERLCPARFLDIPTSFIK